ncbi:MAG: hypothetical protein J6V72_09720 [Kiritimatiellae bacterium]|nr:hypothetical protein [Kiritimatiellia bacterium]
MGRYFWPVYVAVASLSCAAVWHFAPVLGARLPPDVRARICSVFDSATGLADAEDVAESVAVDIAAAEGPDKRDPSARGTGAPARDPNRTPAQRGVRPVDSIHAAWGVLTGITPVEKLDGSPVGNVSGGRFFRIKETISTASGLMVTGTFIPQKTQQTVRIPFDRISCFSGVPGFLSTNQQVCLRKYYELTGEAEALKAKLMGEAAKKSPYLQGAADALRELRAREKEAKKLRNADADTLRKTTYEISQLRVKVQELNQKHREWKAEHAAELPDPEQDPAYREIIDRRREYARSIPGLTL